MRVPQRLDYALRAAVELAQLPPGRYLAAGEIADRLGMPRRFVEQQVTALARAGLVECRRGAAGGCKLAREPSQISVLELVEVVERDVLDVPHVTGSAATAMWDSLAEEMAGFLSDVTLAALAERQRELAAAAASMYSI